jgi:hypothetical protein
LDTRIIWLYFAPRLLTLRSRHRLTLLQRRRCAVAAAERCAGGLETFESETSSLAHSLRQRAKAAALALQPRMAS